MIFVPSIYMDHYGGPSSMEHSSEYLENHIEDEMDYLPLSTNEESEYDWSPPNGELPDTNYNAAISLGSYFGNEDSHRNIDESWIDQEGNVKNDDSKSDLKRALGFSRNKKNQVLCRVQRVIHRHSEPGYEFFPKSFTSYTCHPVSSSQVDRSLSTSHDTCFVTGNNCITIEKEQLFLKRRQNTNCWNHFIEAVGAGCKCLSRKYNI